MLIDWQLVNDETVKLGENYQPVKTELSGFGLTICSVCFVSLGVFWKISDLNNLEPGMPIAKHIIDSGLTATAIGLARVVSALFVPYPDGFNPV